MMTKVGSGAKHPLIDFFSQKTWRPGELERKVAKLPKPHPGEAPGTGTWQLVSGKGAAEAYRDSLAQPGALGSDPQRYLTGYLGLAENLYTPQESSAQLLAGFGRMGKFAREVYYPGPKWLGKLEQAAMIDVVQHSPRLLRFIDRMFERLVMDPMKAGDLETYHPYGKMGEIERGPKSDLPLDRTYHRLLQLEAEAQQEAWSNNFHDGTQQSIYGNLGAVFGTDQIAQAVGFTAAQAKTIADSCIAVDHDETHYRDPEHPEKPRRTKATPGLHHGTMALHFNVSDSSDSEEDSRITAAETHLERAVALACEGYYEACERELGIGLHSVQDIFAHGQASPAAHGMVGHAPDAVDLSPRGAFEAAIATDAYLSKFVARIRHHLGMDVSSVQKGNAPAALSPKPRSEAQTRAATLGRPKAIDVYDALVRGNAAVSDKLLVANALAAMPQGLRARLVDRDVVVRVIMEDERFTDLGFGQDLDGDGRVTPGLWVDVNADGARGLDEVEDLARDGQSWNDHLGGYDRNTRTIVLRDSVLDDDELFARVLREEIIHAIDHALLDDPALSEQWKAYRKAVFDRARELGHVPVTERAIGEVLAEELGRK